MTTNAGTDLLNVEGASVGQVVSHIGLVPTVCLGFKPEPTINSYRKLIVGRVRRSYVFDVNLNRHLNKSTLYT